MDEKFEEWCLVEIMGHQRIAGKVTEAELGGSSFLRIDVPQIGDKPGFTKFLGAGAIYAITPVTEEVGRGLAEAIRSQPVEQWNLPEKWRDHIWRGEHQLESGDPTPEDYPDLDSSCGP